MTRQIAMLSYGSSHYKIEHEALPIEFDFSDPIACARKICAVMSNASGGHRITDCTLRMDRERRTANITGRGMHVYFSDPSTPKLTLEEAIAVMDRTVKVELGSVLTDQYGNGWKRARWC